MTGSPARGPVLASSTAARWPLLAVAVALAATMALPSPARATEAGPDDGTPPPTLGVAVTRDAASVPHERGQLAYTVEVANPGTAALTALSLTDTLPEALTVAGVEVAGPWTCVLPSGSATTLERDPDPADDAPDPAPPTADGQLHCTLDELAAGASAPPLTVTVQVPDDFHGDVDYGVEAAAAGVDPVRASATTTVEAPASEGPAGELAVELTDDVADTVPHGGGLTWTITVTNPGPVELTELSVADTLPADVVVAGVTAPGPWTCVLPDQGGTGGQLYCTLDVLAPGAGAPPLRVAVEVPEGVSGQLRNVVVADSAQTDPVEAASTTTVDVATEVLGQVIEKDSPDAAPSPDAPADGAAVRAQAELARTGMGDEHRWLAVAAVGLLALGAVLLRLGRPVTAGR